MEGGQLVLDPQIRDWVLIPIVVVMFLVGVLRDRVSAPAPVLTLW